MKRLIPAVLFLLAASGQAQTIPPQVQTVPVYPYPGDAKACEVFSRASAEMMKELPKWLDSVTRLEGMVVLCAFKAVTIKKTIVGDLNDFPDDWAEKWKSQHNRDNCDKPHLRQMIERGWNFYQEVSFSTGERFDFRATCS